MEYVQKCLICEEEFKSEKPAKYCSGACRVTAHRSGVTDVIAVTDKPAWQKVMDGEPSGVDIGFGPNDYTREMVEERVKQGDAFVPNWYAQGFKSRNHVWQKST